MKFKDLPIEQARHICEQHLYKSKYKETACETCPLFIPRSTVCGKVVAQINHQFGDYKLKEEPNNAE